MGRPVFEVAAECTTLAVEHDLDFAFAAMLCRWTPTCTGRQKQVAGQFESKLTRDPKTLSLATTRPGGLGYVHASMSLTPAW